MRHFCTLFDRNYLNRGFALYRSLVRHCGEFRLHVLCLDTVTHDALATLALPNMRLLQVGELQSWDSALAHARQNRAAVEFYFTCKPVLLGYLFARDSSVARLDYLDSDLWFFSTPETAEKAYAASSVALSPHRFDATNAHRLRYGRFNAGWVSVSAGEEGRRFVAWWRNLCLEWCSMAVEETRFADQKYLDRVPGLFPAACALTHPGMNLGPWNIGGSHVEMTPRGVEVDGQPLVFFHFHGTQRMLFNLHESGLHDYGVELTPPFREGIYRPYVSELADCGRHLSVLPAELRTRLAPERVELSRRFVRTLRAVARHTAVSPTG